MTSRLAPVLRAGHGAMRLSLRDGADRAFFLLPAPSDWDVVFAAQRLLPCYLPRVFAHLAHRLAVAVLETTPSVCRLAEVTSRSARSAEGTAPENNPHPSLPSQSGERITAKPRGKSSSKAQLVLSNADGDDRPCCQ